MNGFEKCIEKQYDIYSAAAKRAGVERSVAKMLALPILYSTDSKDKTVEQLEDQIVKAIEVIGTKGEIK